MLPPDRPVLRVGIIGAGGIAATLHLPELVQMQERCRVTGIAGRSAHRLAFLADRFAIARTTTSYADLIDDPDIDAVVIATPHPHHVEWGLRAIEAGKHLMMQKPLSTRQREIAAFTQAAAASPGVTVMVLPHFGSELRALRQAVESGDIGRPTGMRVRTSHGGPELYYRQVAAFLGERPPADLWFYERDKAGGGALADLGVYAVAAVVGVLGPVKAVTAVLATVGKPTVMEDTAELILETEAGMIATASASWCDPAVSWSVSIYGGAGRVDWSMDETPRFVGVRDLSPDAAAPEMRALSVPFVGTAHGHWLDCIDAGTQPPDANAATASHVASVMIAATISASQSRRVLVCDPQDANATPAGQNLL